MYNIVGMRYHPPATALIYSVPDGTPLLLEIEPENIHDRFAVRVVLRTRDIPKNCYKRIAESVADYGYNLAQILNKPNHKLGFIPRESLEVFLTIKKLGSPLQGRLSFIDDEHPVIIGGRE